ncbi:MAG: 30S ribosome-binding factor RbfA [Terriglobia bacterium]
MAPLAHRHERLADQIRIEIEEMIEGELKDPRIGFATVTHVDLSPDLRHARVLVTVTGDDDSQRDTLEGLSSAAGYVRREIVQRLNLRRAPELVFDLDREAAQAERVESLLKNLKKDE